MAIEIVDFPMKNGGSFHSYVKLPEGNLYIISINSYRQDGAPKIAFSWFISGLTMVYGRYNYSYRGL